MENIKLNLPPFYVGQKVVYITGKNLPKDSLWTVMELDRCPHCGGWTIVINENFPENGIYLRCNKCSEVRKKKTVGKRYFNAASFAPIEERFISLAEVIKIESPLTCVN